MSMSTSRCRRRLMTRRLRRPRRPAKVPRRYLTVAKLWTIRDGEGYRLDLEVARGSLHHRQSLGWSWIAGVGVSQIDEQTPYYGHADEIQAHDLAAHGFVAWALRLGPIETRCGFAAGLERTSGMQTDWTVSHDVSQIAPMAELYAQASFDIGPVTALFGDRMIVHAERYSTIDGMDWFTREPTLEAYVGIAAPLD